MCWLARAIVAKVYNPKLLVDMGLCALDIMWSDSPKVLFCKRVV